MDNIYTFVYRGVLTDESPDKAGRKNRNTFGAEEVAKTKRALAFDLLDTELLSRAERMAVIYTAIHTFENMVRNFVLTAMAEAHQENWWTKVSTGIQRKVKGRMEDEARFRWHGSRGASEIEYCDFGDLSSIIVTNWDTFSDVLADMEWAKATLSVLERSRNIVMHGGVLSHQDIERIGLNIRDWIRQAG